MFRLTFIILAILALPCIALAQGVVPSACPNILITGPAGIVPPGQDALFTVNVGNLNGSPEPKFKWSVTGGNIIQGQAERTISVRSDGKNSLVVTVEVLGIPTGCPTTFSDTAFYCEPPPTAEKIGEVNSIDAKAIQRESDRVITEMRDLREHDQLYIMLGMQNGWEEKEAEQLEKLVVDALSGPSGRRHIHETRITIVRCGAGNYPVEFWRVPIGAKNPPCWNLNAKSLEPETREEIKCPAITVIGPAGKMHSGSEIIFTANVAGADLDKLVFRWLTSGGKIVGGQGSPSIRVNTTRADNGTTLTAYLSVIGLPDSCSRIAEGEAIVQDGGDPPLIDEFGVLSDRDLRQRLKYVATELKLWPNYHLYIISYTKPTEQKVVITRRQQRIQQILIENGVSSDNITVVDGGVSSNNKVNTRFYAVPPKT